MKARANKKSIDRSARKYLANCFLLLLPIFLWNLVLYDSLPKGFSAPIFWLDIPPIITYGENALRILLFGLPLVMILSVKTKQEKIGLSLYLVGTLLYFSSWIILIVSPESAWSTSLLGFMAPAYTPLLWLIGIGLIGNRSFIGLPRPSLIYLMATTLFVLFHSLHTYLVFQKL